MDIHIHSLHKPTIKVVNHVGLVRMQRLIYPIHRKRPSGTFGFQRPPWNQHTIFVVVVKHVWVFHKMVVRIRMGGYGTMGRIRPIER